MRYAEYVQRLDYLPFPLTELESRLESRPIKEWSWVLHDKDTYEDGTLKPAHIHVEMKLNTDQSVESVCKWFDDKPERIEKGKSDNKAFLWENMNMYLIHDTKSSVVGEKYPYPIEEVRSNFDYPALIEKARQGIKEAKENRKKDPLEEVLLKICNNEIPRLKLGDYVDDYTRIKRKKDIDTAYNIRDEKIAKEVDRMMNVMYFCGPSGTGKSTLARTIARDKGYDIFVSGSSNDPLQGYVGQECIILDDIRGSDWKINDLLKMLDNHMNSLVKSRYSNKLLNDCKLMILTSVQTIDELYRNLSNYDHEPIEQLKRRCGTYVVFSENRLKFYQYSEGERDYLFVEEAVNPVPFMEFVRDNTNLTNDMISMVSNMAKKNGIDLSTPINEMQHFVQLSIDDDIASNEEDLPFDE